MRILIVNTSERTGGAAVAANRLMAALNNSGEKAKMLVRDKSSSDPSVVQLPAGVRQRWNFVWERLRILATLHFDKTHLWEIDIANAGTDITSLPEFREADIVHLAWVNQGMLSLSDIRKIAACGKPIVWTMHDLWPAAAICHYAGECRQFTSECHHCPLLPGEGGGHDLSNKVWRKKQELYDYGNFHFVACSQWLEHQARESALLRHSRLTSIPNPIDTRIFCPQDRREARRILHLPDDKRIILFAAQKATDRRKGAHLLIEALNKLHATDNLLAQNTAVAVLGSHGDELSQQIALPTYPLGYVSGDKNLAMVYNAADLFVLPSMEDNLPNTIMEALACGVPCVGFDIGGIPEMIDHNENGYVARAGDTDDLAKGIKWVLGEADTEQLQHACLSKVARCYSQSSVARRYAEVYAYAKAHNRLPL